MIKVYKNNLEVLEKYKDFFDANQVQYNLMIGILKRENKSARFYASVIDDMFLLGVLSGKNMIIASNTTSLPVYKELVDFMHRVQYPGIIGTKEHCELYNDVFIDKYNTTLKLGMNQRIYSCEAVNDYSEDIGLVRYAIEEDIPLLENWTYEFILMVEGKATIEEAREVLKAKIDNKTLYVLEVDGEVVSMTGRSRQLEYSETISMVYTPKSLRKKGYASRIVEEVTRYILEDKKIACLYTDLANPISNSIYMKIGYVPVCDSMVLDK